ncbi:34-kDa subunit of RNA polymerase III (C) [Stygiomarasmius scandens]|uniref:34-kDa subunit of RNA polymerase III (C) n=1 Tax=Marasmiellus scandens TaxID=2682957 RepID=A0ABR1K1J3_9AGAR
MSSNKRPLNDLEGKLHQAALAAENNELTAKQAEAIVPDNKARQKALNFLLSVGYFRPLSDKKGSVVFRAVTKSELESTKDLTEEEKLVLGHIKTSGNEGIWTKHLKAKTNLHQNVIDRCLKTLTQKKLIKRVPSVQHPTRKIYMLEGVEPSVTLTGGPWYQDNELDTEFIESLTKACFKIIRDASFPQRRTHHAEGALYPISRSPQYPTAQQIRNALRQARLTDIELSVEHVETLLNVLVLDGEIEKLPAFGTSLWDPSVLEDGSGDERRSKKKRKHRSSSGDEDEITARKQKGKKRATANSDSEGEDTSKKSKRKRTRDIEGGSDSDSSPKSRKKTKRVQGSEDESEEDNRFSSRHKSKKKASYSSESESSDSDSDDERPRRRSRSRKRSISPRFFSYDDEDEPGGGIVYRAIRQERLSLGWSQAPCSVCPSFEFCKEGGPVNPQECMYYGDWLMEGTVAAIEDAV